MVDTGDLKSPASNSVRVRVSFMANEKAGFDLPFSLARVVETRNGATAKAGKRLRWSVFSAGDLEPENLEAEGESRSWQMKRQVSTCLFH